MANKAKSKDEPIIVKTDQPQIIDPQFQEIVNGLHGDPHHVLGAHVDGPDAVVRAFRPSARAAKVLLTDGTSVGMARVHEGGIFEATVPAKTLGDDRMYRIEATYDDGAVNVTDDPYRFWPTVGDLDLYLFGQGRHEHLWHMMGAHVRTQQGATGVSFAVWAPNARAVRVAGDFNFWDGRILPMRRLGSSGVWELFVPNLEPGMHYKFEIQEHSGRVIHRADPFAFATEVPPRTSSVIYESKYTWQDAEWMTQRARTDLHNAPFSVYEVHLGSWRRKGDGTEFLSYRELAEQLPQYVKEMGFTHVELMPVAEHPFGGSWGYQVSSYYAPTSRFGSVDDFKFLVDAFHAEGIGVIVDWVPAHFPKDEWALAKFDGTELYEHADPRKGEHPDWGTLVFNFSRHEVRNFLLANALYWIEEMHIDGLRVDAVASMLYLDYSRKEGEWVPNEFGGRENLEAVSFLKETNETVYRLHPGVVTIAEESTAWQGVSRPTYLGGLGFGFKWNMGWMHDSLEYFSKDPIHRRYHHNDLTFSLVYAWTENFMLPLSHDEVVHGKGSLIEKMPGDRWQKHANLRSMYAWMWAHPGKQLLFMGGEIAQTSEWSHDRSIDWHLLEFPEHSGTQSLVKSLNTVYADTPALWDRDFADDGFRWIDASDIEQNVVSFLRKTHDGSQHLVCVANLSPVPRYGYRIGMPHGGPWREVLNTDAHEFGGSGLGNMGYTVAKDEPWHGLPAVAEMTLPPLAVIWLAPGE
jgi:1,4-alpha-glucan branching enzyme